MKCLHVEFVVMARTINIPQYEGAVACYDFCLIRQFYEKMPGQKVPFNFFENQYLKCSKIVVVPWQCTFTLVEDIQIACDKGSKSKEGGSKPQAG